MATAPFLGPTTNLHAPALWRSVNGGAGVAIRLRGHLFGGGLAASAPAVKSADDDRLPGLVRDTDGLFAVIVEGGAQTFAAVDRVRSIPLFYGWDGERWRVSDNGGALARTLGLGPDDVDPDGALAFAMAGYTIGADTLYRPLKALVAGQAVLLGPGPAERRIAYDRYAAWEVLDRPDEALERDLAEVTLGVLEKMIRSAEGRPIVVPLSAGLDSRLVVSGLRHLGHRNVRCFSYGIPGNHEARAAQKIAERLGYPWRFVPYTPRGMRAFFASDDHAAYLDFADTCTNVPFEQDLPAIRVLQQDGYIPADAIMVNGNSGDFISGAHVLSPLQTIRDDLDPEARRALVLDTLTNKHFRLWQALATPGNDARIKARLGREIDGLPLDAEGLHGVYEFAECQDRQSKFVISGQRIYEYAGLDWRLPLWDCAYLDFWRTVPLRAKRGQTLYAAMLRNQDWGGVWRGAEWTFPKTIVPHWIRPLRFFLKALHAPLGRDAWHRFEKRLLGYWTENLQAQAFVPYLRAAQDRRGARHMVAWHTEAALGRHGIDWQGRQRP